MKTLAKTTGASALSKFRQQYAPAERRGSRSSALCRFVEKHSNTAINNKMGYVMLIVDGTGSMHPIWSEVKVGASKLLNTIHELVPEMKISIIVYDESSVRNALRPTNVLKDLQHFVSNLETAGGTSYTTHTEALEVGLDLYAQSKSSFAIVIGDAASNDNTTFKKAMSLIKSGHKSIYTVGVNSGNDEMYAHMRECFQNISRMTEGKYFDLEGINELIDVLSAMFAIEANKVDDLKKMWKRKNVQVSSGVTKLLTY